MGKLDGSSVERRQVFTPPLYNIYYITQGNFIHIFHDTILLTCYDSTFSSTDMCVISATAVFINGIPYIFRCYDITQLSHRSLVNCISDER
jgi:hypothetical protein